MFPFDIDDELIDVEVDEDTEPSDYEIDFTTGKLTGRMIKGLDAIKQRVMIVFGTDRYYYPQYSWAHGHELSELIGKSYDPAFVKAEAKRMVEDALAPDEDIESVEDFDCVIEGDRLLISFRINTIYGDEEVNVNV